MSTSKTVLMGTMFFSTPRFASSLITFNHKSMALKQLSQNLIKQEFFYSKASFNLVKKKCNYFFSDAVEKNEQRLYLTI